MGKEPMELNAKRIAALGAKTCAILLLYRNERVGGRAVFRAVPLRIHAGRRNTDFTFRDHPSECRGMGPESVVYPVLAILCRGFAVYQI